MKGTIEWHLITAIAIGGAFGAVARYYCAQITLPFGIESSTLLVNLTGSLLLGLFFGISIFQIELSPLLKMAITTGFFGSFTTFSTFSLENAQMIEKGDWSIMILNILLQVVLGIGLAWSGLFIGLRCSQ